MDPSVFDEYLFDRGSRLGVGDVELEKITRRLQISNLIRDVFSHQPNPDIFGCWKQVSGFCRHFEKRTSEKLVLIAFESRSPDWDGSVLI